MLNNNFSSFTDASESFQGAGASSPQDLFDLQKALGTGTSAVAGQTDGSALRVEALEGTLKVLTFLMKHIKLWRMIPKRRAFNTVEEFNQLLSYGDYTNPFFQEGGLPDEEDAIYRRQISVVKFLGNTRVVSHPLAMVRPAHGPVITRETMNGVMWLLERLETSLFHADDRLNPLHFKGIGQQIEEGAPDSIIDLRGEPLESANVEIGAQFIADRKGFLELIMAPSGVHADLAMSYYGSQRVLVPPAHADGIFGTPLKGIATNNGLVQVETNIFLQPGGTPPTKAGKKSPASPPSFTGAAVSATSQFTSGTYDYVITAVGERGTESLPTPITAAVTVAGPGEVARLTIGRVATDPQAFSYRIYRKESGTFKFMKEIPDPSLADPTFAGSTFTYDDANGDLPGTSRVFGFYMNPQQGIAFAQLAPLMKMNLALISAAFRFLVLLYGTPEVYAPAKQIIWKNVGRRDPSTVGPPSP